jgi:regulator of sirC expression with transglutaminase-like and TPR domain
VDPTDEFAALVQSPDAPLDRLAFLIAACGDAPVDVDAGCARLDDLADDFGGGTASDLMGWMGIRGFRGNSDEYYDPANSYLNRVLDRGLGIPITLSVVAIEIGRRAGVDLVGIGLPGEFVVAERDHPDRFHNPFRQQSMTPDDVAGLLRRFAGPGAELSTEMRRPVGAAHIAARMLLNLSHIFTHTDRVADLVWALRLRTSLPGAPASVRRELVVALAKAGRTWDAAAELDTVLRLPATPDERAADRTLLQQLRAGLN